MLIRGHAGSEGPPTSPPETLRFLEGAGQLRGKAAAASPAVLSGRSWIWSFLGVGGFLGAFLHLQPGDTAETDWLGPLRSVTLSPTWLRHPILTIVS